MLEPFQDNFNNSILGIYSKIFQFFFNDKYPLLSVFKIMFCRRGFSHPTSHCYFCSWCTPFILKSSVYKSTPQNHFLRKIYMHYHCSYRKLDTYVGLFPFVHCLWLSVLSMIKMRYIFKFDWFTYGTALCLSFRTRLRPPRI